MKNIWNALGDVKLAFILLCAASAVLLTGSLYAGGDFELFNGLNRMRIQDWLPAQLADNPEAVWWIPLLFLIMGLLGLNTFICAFNRVAQLARQHRSLPVGRLCYLLVPSMIHVLFIMIMIGHMTTFTAGRWQTLPVNPGGRIAIGPENTTYRVQSVNDQFFPETSALRGRIAQTTVTLAGADRKITRLSYARPVYMDGRFFFLDKIKKNKPKVKPRILPSAAEETCNKAHVYMEPEPAQRQGRQLLLIVSDPGLPVIIAGLILILTLMVGYFLLRPTLTRT